jgi:hypothetical protein
VTCDSNDPTCTKDQNWKFDWNSIFQPGFFNGIDNPNTSASSLVDDSSKNNSDDNSSDSDQENTDNSNDNSTENSESESNNVSNNGGNGDAISSIDCEANDYFCSFLTGLFEGIRNNSNDTE